MLSYGLVDALLSELQVGETKPYYPTSSASTNATSWTSYPSGFCGLFESELCLDYIPTASEDIGLSATSNEAPAAGPISFEEEEYEDVLFVSILPGYELDKDDVEHVFSVLGDLKGHVSIISGHRAIVKVTAGQGATIAAILDGHTLNGIPGSLTVNLIDTKLVTPPSSPKYQPNIFQAVPPARDILKSAGSVNNNSTTRYPRTATTTASSADYLCGSVAEFTTPPPCHQRRPLNKKGLDTTTAPTQSTSSGGVGINAVRKWTARYEIQVPTNNSFHVTRKIIGARGCNMKSINEATGAKLRLRGRGSGYLEGLDNEECEDPLHLCISSCDEKMFTLAKLKVDQLLQQVYQQYYQYAIQNSLPDPCLYNIRRKEQFLLNK